MPRQAVIAAPCGLVQVIRLHWDKSARGGQGARDRNAVPLALDGPADHLLNACGQLHVEEAHGRKCHAFAKRYHYRHQRVALEVGYNYGCVSVAAHPEGLLVRYQWDWERGGAPDRWFINVAGNAESASRDLVVQPGQ